MDSTTTSSPQADATLGAVGNDTSATLPPSTPKSRGLQFTAKPADMVEVGAMLFQEAEEVLRGGGKQRLRIRLGSKTLAEIPLTMGAVGVMAAAMLAVALSRLTIDIE